MNSLPASSPIGVFDSGVGGLSVLRHIRALLPHEDLVYVADSGFVPYGNKPPETIQERSTALSRFLVNQHQCKALVVACNTATAIAVPLLREQFHVPVVGMEPAVKPAAAATRNGTIGILATVGTLKSARFAALLDRFADGLHVITQPCPELVEQVERGELDTPKTRLLVQSFLEPLLAQGADTIILGCTHYPFLRPVIEEIADSKARVIDSGAAVARQLKHRLEGRRLLSPKESPGTEEFWTSGDCQQAEAVISRLWERPVHVQPLPQVTCAGTASI